MPFIKENSAAAISHGQTILDIFAGTCSVGYSFKRTNRIFANDAEEYAYFISKALLSNYSDISACNITNSISLAFEKSFKDANRAYSDYINDEIAILSKGAISEIEGFYQSIPTVWNGGVREIIESRHLFLQFYSNSYFGVTQAAEIDSLRIAIEEYRNTNLFSPLMAALFYAMKECVFSKDGHMAQPLGLGNNINKLLKTRQKSIFALFNAKLMEFFSCDFAASNYENECFNLNFEDLLKIQKIKEEVDVIYADPPYTDMQYSRYYHLLNFVARYKPAPLTMIRGSHTKGLYTEGRFQSKLSKRSQSLDTLASLVDYCCAFKKNLVISFAYPTDATVQKTDRYVMTIESLVSLCKERFGASNVDVHSCDYTHSNNRNSEQKKVLEYLVVCKKD